MPYCRTVASVVVHVCARCDQGHPAFVSARADVLSTREIKYL